MEIAVAAAVLLAALLHAGWHALVKSSGDQVTALAGMNLVSGVAAAAFLPFVRPPAGVAAAVIAASVLLHVGYKLALARLYVHAELSVGYPVARGLTPAIATLLAIVLLGERPAPQALLGTVFICLGILALVLERAERRLSWSVLGSAGAAGGAVAAYSVVDAYGIRLSGDWLGFAAWLVALDSLAFVAYAVLTRRSAATRAWRQGWERTLISGLLGTASFGVFMWALGRAHVGPVTALRETSMVFAVLIGMAFLHERASGARIASVTLVMGGAGAIALAR